MTPSGSDPRSRERGGSFCYGLGVRLAALTSLLVLSAVAPPAAHAQPSGPVSTPAAPRGVAVVAPGPPDEELGRSCRELAREVYRLEGLRPDVDEGSARALCGGDPGVEAGPKRVAELRQGLTATLEGASSGVLAAALADELGITALVLVGREGAATTVRVVRVAQIDGKPALFVEPTRLDATPTGEPPVTAWATAARAVAVLVEDEGEGSSDGATSVVAALPDGSSAKGPGPRRDALLGVRTSAPETPGDKAFYESPWFWVAAGSVAAVGLVVLIVSQATDVGEGTVKVTGKVSP